MTTKKVARVTHENAVRLSPSVIGNLSVECKEFPLVNWEFYNLIYDCWISSSAKFVQYRHEPLNYSLRHNRLLRCVYFLKKPLALFSNPGFSACSSSSAGRGPPNAFCSSITLFMSIWMPAACMSCASFAAFSLISGSDMSFIICHAEQNEGKEKAISAWGKLE